MPFSLSTLRTQLRKMQSTFAQWQEKRANRGPSSSSRAVERTPSVSSRVATTPRPPGSASDGILSFSQMQRSNRPPSRRPPSEVGSVRSVRSVMTVEEQVNDLEQKVDQLMAAQEAAAVREEQTQRLLEELLKRTPAPSVDMSSKPTREGAGPSSSR